MADEIDQANDRAMLATEKAQRAAQEAARNIPKGEPGECDRCEEYNARLVGGMCAPCRDAVAELTRRVGR